MKFEIQADIVLSKGREYSALRGHPWIFSGAISKISGEASDGSIVKVLSAGGENVGYGFYNSKTSIAVRLFASQEQSKNKDPKELIFSNIESAIKFRQALLNSDLNCCRMINAEGDNLPGLVVDYYNRHLVVQIGIAGIDQIKNEIFEFLKSKLDLVSIYERSDSSSREEEGLSSSVGQVFGTTPDEVVVNENGMQLSVNIASGQKTGLFLDQRDMRKFVREVSKDKSVLNCFSYNGGFSVAALLGGAKRVVSVDSSESAIESSNRNVEINNLDPKLHDPKCVNAFDYLGGTHERFDVVILDPPAFAKQKGHLKNAFKAYRQINSFGFKLLNPGGVLITSSCSNFVTKEDFEREVTEAAINSKRSVSLLGRHRQAIDHPVSLAHTQGEYIKSLILLVN